MSHSLNKYSVYLKKTGESVIIGGTAEECAREMDLTSVDSFWAIWQLIKTDNPKASQKWAIERYEDGDDGQDFVSVIRCKKCKYCRYDPEHKYYACISNYGLDDLVEPDDFCSNGERKFK